jgi:hypothetical protein
MSIVSSSTILLAMAMWMPMCPWRLMTLFWTVCLNGFLVFVDSQQGLRFRSLWVVEACVLSICVPILSGFIIRQAWRSGTVGSRYLVSALVLWTAWGACIFWLQTELSVAISIPFAALVLEIGLLPIPLVTLLTAPIAFAAYRHR